MQFERGEVCCLCLNWRKNALLQSYDSILSNLTSADVRVLIETEDEYDRRGSFTRIVPSPFGSQYLNYMLPRPRYNDLLLDAWTRRYFHNRIEGEWTSRV